MLKTKSLFKIIKLNKYQKQKISTLSPLGSQFNRKPKSAKSIFGYKSNAVGLFGIKELKSPEGFYNLKDDVAASVKTLLNEALSTERPKRKLVQIFDDISNNLCKVADLSEFVRTSHPNEQYRQAADYSFACISEIVENLNTNLELYNKLKEFYINSDHDLKVDECDKRVTKLYLADFEQSGIHLDEKNRKKFVQINNKLIELLTKFQINSQLPSEIFGQNVDIKFNEM
jgi:mitochondrial intermediate peptidase